MLGVGALAASTARAEQDDLAPEKSAKTQTEAQPAPKKPLNFYSLLTADDLRAELEIRHLEEGTFAELVERVSRGLLAAPYILSPLGEGALPDPDPKFRLDAFDCTTFVETAIALSQCDALGEVESTLDRVRYIAGADARFDTRNHLMTAQWVPHLIDTGVVEDVTEEIGGDHTKWMELKLTHERWRKRKIAKTLVLPIEAIPEGTFRLPYITMSDVLSMMERVPPGTIVNIVRPDVPSSPEIITHQGLVIVAPGSEERVVRHASPVAMRVIDETLEHMMKRYEKPKVPRKWPIVGANFLRIKDPRAKLD